jgi:transposase
MIIPKGHCQLTNCPGQKKYLFCGSDSGGERAAAIHTLVTTAKLNRLNPETYLRDILAKIADGHTINRIAELVPWRIIPLPTPHPHS